MSRPTLGPGLTPETIMSTWRGAWRRRPNTTASAGVPLTCQASTPSIREWARSDARSRCSVKAALMPDWLKAGATTITSPYSATASARYQRPSASMPSSLQTKMKGRSVMGPPCDRQARAGVREPGTSWLTGGARKRARKQLERVSFELLSSSFPHNRRRSEGSPGELSRQLERTLKTALRVGFEPLRGRFGA